VTGRMPMIPTRKAPIRSGTAIRMRARGDMDDRLQRCSATSMEPR
jgi:hypothetical protein